MAVPLMTGLVLNFNGCTTNSPLGSGSEELQDGLNMVRIGDGPQTLNKGVVTISELITPETGGELVLNLGFDNKGNSSHDGESSIDVVEHKTKTGLTIKLKVLPGSVDDSTTISLRLDKDFLDMDFGPDGTVFDPPAKLSIDAKGLDFSNANSVYLKVYYYNSVTNQWKGLQHESFDVSMAKGDFKINNARIPHFSRYAVGWGN
jgi:hypothetical protein